MRTLWLALALVVSTILTLTGGSSIAAADGRVAASIGRRTPARGLRAQVRQTARDLRDRAELAVDNVRAAFFSRHVSTARPGAISRRRPHTLRSTRPDDYAMWHAHQLANVVGHAIERELGLSPDAKELWVEFRPSDARHEAGIEVRALTVLRSDPESLGSLLETTQMDRLVEAINAAPGLAASIRRETVGDRRVQVILPFRNGWVSPYRPQEGPRGSSSPRRETSFNRFDRVEVAQKPPRFRHSGALIPLRLGDQDERFHSGIVFIPEDEGAPLDEDARMFLIRDGIDAGVERFSTEPGVREIELQFSRVDAEATGESTIVMRPLARGSAQVNLAEATIVTLTHAILTAPMTAAIAMQLEGSPASRLTYRVPVTEGQMDVDRAQLVTGSN